MSGARLASASDAGGWAPAAPAPRLILASASPRRQQMLAESGVESICLPPDLDDADLAPGGATPSAWAMAMAWFKAVRVARLLGREALGAERVILAADTVCDLDGAIVGKPADARDAERIVRAFSGRAHRVFTGYCVLRASPAQPALQGHRTIAVDSAVVHLGELSEAQISAHVGGDGWRGKAGGYNFGAQRALGWPLRCEGDEATVTGLPMRRLAPLLASFRASVSRGPHVGAPCP